MKVIALAALLMVTLVYPAAGASGGSVGSLQKVSDQSPFQPGGSHECSMDDGFRDLETETSISVDPSDEGRIAVAWPQDNALGIIVASSQDGGATWTRTVVDGFTTCTGSDKARVSHPRVSFATDGRLYLAAFPVGEWTPDPRNIETEILVARSDDGGLTWSQPHQITEAERLSDFDGIAVEPDTAAVNVIWAENEGVDPNGEPIYLSRSTDGGETWTKRLVTRATPGAIGWTKIAPLPSGELVLFVQEIGPPTYSQGPISVLISETKGETWSEPLEVVGDALQEWPSVALTRKGDVYLAYRTGPVDGEFSVWLTRSDDGGRSWTEPATAFSYPYAYRPLPHIALAVARERTIGVLHYQTVGACDELQALRGTCVHQARVEVSPDCGREWTSMALGEPFSHTDLGLAQGLTAVPHGFLASVSLGGEQDTTGPTDVFVGAIEWQGDGAASCNASHSRFEPETTRSKRAGA